MNDKNIYIWRGALLFLSLFLHSCQRIISDDIGQEKKSTTYLQFNMVGITMPESATRAQGDTPSIQTDNADYEDYVGELAVLVYDASTGKHIKTHFTSHRSFMMELETAGDKNYHFCFIANYPKSWKQTLNGIVSYDKIESTLQELKDFSGLYDGAKLNSFFPMARIYKNQVIKKGGSVANPIPFMPTTIRDTPVGPISNWSESREISGVQHSINLVRSAAKISLSLTGLGLKDVTKVELVNVASQQSYMELEHLSTPSLLSNRVFQGSIPSTTNSIFNSKMYVPERLIGKASNSLGWDTTSDRPIGTPTYIKISMKSGFVYSIPVVTLTKQDDLAGKYYIDVARNDDRSILADYSIVRNNHYHFAIEIPKDDKKLEVQYSVMPWNLIESEMSYARPKYELAIKVINSKTNEEKEYTEIGEVVVPPYCYVDISFKISEPRGTMWAASITNGLDFSLEGDSNDLVNLGDIVGSVPEKTYKMKIKPRADYYKEAKFTQFFITVEGRELDLSTTSNSDGKYLGEGSTQRWNIKQVMQ